MHSQSEGRIPATVLLTVVTLDNLQAKLTSLHKRSSPAQGSAHLTASGSIQTPTQATHANAHAHVKDMSYQKELCHEAVLPKTHGQALRSRSQATRNFYTSS